MTTDWLEPAAGGKFCHLEPPKRNFPYKNTGFGEVFKGENTEILREKNGGFLKNPTGTPAFTCDFGLKTKVAQKAKISISACFPDDWELSTLL